VKIKLGRQWMNKIDGLCKNFDGNQTNDCTVASGSDITTQPNKGTLLGDSYQVFDPEEPMCKSSLVDDLPNQCKDDKTLEEAKVACELVVDHEGPFADCVKRMSRGFLQNFLEDCNV
ncbi:unnamed protein product, partial [Owenia fusiformis]